MERQQESGSFVLKKRTRAGRKRKKTQRTRDFGRLAEIARGERAHRVLHELRVGVGRRHGGGGLFCLLGVRGVWTRIRVRVGNSRAVGSGYV